MTITVKRIVNPNQFERNHPVELRWPTANRTQRLCLTEAEAKSLADQLRFVRWYGKRIRINVADSNEVEGRGEVTIPIGWCGTVCRLNHLTECGQPMFDVVWDDNPNDPGGNGNMGWCIWSAEELERDATPL